MTHHANSVVTVFVPLAVLGLALLASPHASACRFDEPYPRLPDLPGPDIEGERVLLLYLDGYRAIVGIDDLCFELDDRPLEVGLAWSMLTLVFLVPDGSVLVVTRESDLSDVLEPSPRSPALVFDIPLDSIETSFELVSHAPLPAPTRPHVIVKPTQDDPDPA